MRPSRLVSQPNIVLILVDDMGYGDFGAFGNDIARTPALDQLISEGTVFTQHYSCSPVCAPARAGLMTGRYPHRTGAIDTLDSRGLDRLALREITMADLFRGAGYATGLVGKWHLGKGDPRYHPNARGFDEFAGFSGGWSNFYDWKLDYNGSFRKADGTYLTDVFTEEAVGFIQRHKREPFFLHVTYNAPHWPLQCPEEEVKPFLDKGDLSPELSTLYGMIHRMDKGVARILEELRTQGLEENTLVVFTSDNGPDFDSGGSFWGQPDVSIERYNAGFRGHKYLVYEGGIRVPAMIRWPAGLNMDKQCGALWHFTDWLPTLTAAAGIKPPETLRTDGQNRLGLLQGDKTEGADIPRFWQWNRYTPLVTCNAAMREGAWKLVRPAVDQAMQVTREDIDMDRRSKTQGMADICRDPLPVHQIGQPHPLQLYNIEEDPFEERDLASQFPEQTARMARALESWYEDVEADRRSIEEARGQ